VLRDGESEPIDEHRLTEPSEKALRLLTAATLVLAAALVAARIEWS
jgi:hypothetical protein